MWVGLYIGFDWTFRGLRLEERLCDEKYHIPYFLHTSKGNYALDMLKFIADLDQRTEKTWKKVKNWLASATPTNQFFMSNHAAVKGVILGPFIYTGPLKNERISPFETINLLLSVLVFQIDSFKHSHKRITQHTQTNTIKHTIVRSGLNIWVNENHISPKPKCSPPSLEVGFPSPKTEGRYREPGSGGNVPPAPGNFGAMTKAEPIETL